MSSDLARYRKIYPRLFRHPGFNSLAPLGRLLTLYVLFGPQSNRLGLFFFSVHTAADDLGTTAETLRKGLTDVTTTFGWHFDAVAKVIFIPTWWKWNPPENINVMRGALKDLAEIPPCGLVDAFAENTADLSSTPGKDGGNVLQTFVEGLRQRLPKASGTQKQYQEPYQNQEQKPRATRKGGSDEKHADAGRSNGAEHDGLTKLETLARKTYEFTGTTADTDLLVDSFFSIARSEGVKDLTRAAAIEALHLARSRQRPS